MYFICTALLQCYNLMHESSARGQEWLHYWHLSRFAQLGAAQRSQRWRWSECSKCAAIVDRGQDAGVEDAMMRKWRQENDVIWYQRSRQGQLEGTFRTVQLDTHNLKLLLYRFLRSSLYIMLVMLRPMLFMLISLLKARIRTPDVLACKVLWERAPLDLNSA